MSSPAAGRILDDYVRRGFRWIMDHESTVEVEERAALAQAMLPILQVGAAGVIGAVAREMYEPIGEMLFELPRPISRILVNTAAYGFAGAAGRFLKNTTYGVDIPERVLSAPKAKAKAVRIRDLSSSLQRGVTPSYLQGSSSQMPGKRSSRSSVKQRVTKRVTKVKRGPLKHPRRSPLSGSSNSLSRAGQGYLRNEGWFKARRQKFWDCEILQHVYTTHYPTISVPLNNFQDMCAIPALGQAGAVTQSARVKSNIIITRLAADISAFVDLSEGGLWPPAGSGPLPTQINVHAYLLLDTQCNGSFESGTGTAGAPFVIDGSTSNGAGAFGFAASYPSNMQNSGRWYVLWEDILIVQCNAMAAGSAFGHFGGATHRCVDITFPDPIVIEYDSDINDGGITQRRTNNLCWCFVVSDYNTYTGVLNPPSIQIPWQRTYFEDV